MSYSKLIDGARDAYNEYLAASKELTKARGGECPKVQWSQFDEAEKAIIIQALTLRCDRLRNVSNLYVDAVELTECRIEELLEKLK